MKNEFSYRKLIWKLIKQNSGYYIKVWLVAVVVVMGLELLYGYSGDLSFFFSILFGFFCLFLMIKTVRHQIKTTIALLEKDYDSIVYWKEEYPFLQTIGEWKEKTTRLEIEEKVKQRELLDYFSLWSHQAKLPATALKLMIQQETINPSDMKIQLDRLENYLSLAMTYARLSSSTTDYSFSLVSLDDLVCPIIRSFSTSCIKKNISVNYDWDKELVLTDPKWLSIVVEQLISNSVKYVDKGGKITIQAYDGQLIVQDNGPGIEKEDIPRIFEKGFTGKRGREIGSESSGIGLYICREITKRLNHSFQIESYPGQGCKAIVKFPKKDERIG